MAKANGAQISVPNSLTPQKPPAMSSFSPISALVTSINMSLSHPILSLSHSLLSLSLSQSNLPPNLHPYLPALSLYLSLHRHRHPHPIMLFHLSNHIKKKNTSLYSLAAILITLSKTLFKIKNLPNDPSLFMHRFSTRLLGHNDSVVSITALQILAEAKAAVEDYDKNPVGFCTAALHLAASAHGHVFSQAEVSNAVRVEFKRLGSEELTVEEFVSRAGKRKTKGLRSVCGHEGSGLCKGCYEVFVDIAGAERSKKKRRRRRNENDDLDVYVNSKKETEYRRVIWEEMNKEYLEEQLAKKIAGLSSVKVKKARKGRVKGGGAGKEKKVEEKRVMSSKVNYDALAKLLGDGEGGKKSDMDAGLSGEERKDGGEEEEGGEEFDEGNHNEEEDYEGGSDGYEEGYGGGEYNENWGNGNEGYEDDDDDDDDFFEF